MQSVDYARSVKIKSLEGKMQLLSLGSKVRLNKDTEAVIVGFTKTHVLLVDDNSRRHKLTLKEAEALCG